MKLNADKPREGGVRTEQNFDELHQGGDEKYSQSWTDPGSRC